jgi:hypothetical protein
MVIFNVFVGCNNGQNKSFSISAAEEDTERVFVGGNAQYVVCNSNYFIMQVEVALENKIPGDWHL